MSTDKDKSKTILACALIRRHRRHPWLIFLSKNLSNIGIICATLAETGPFSDFRRPEDLRNNGRA